MSRLPLILRYFAIVASSFWRPKKEAKGEGGRVSAMHENLTSAGNSGKETYLFALEVSYGVGREEDEGGYALDE